VRSQIDLKVPRKLIDVTNISIRKIGSQDQSIPSPRLCSWFVTDHSRRGTATKSRVPKKGSGLGERMSRNSSECHSWWQTWKTRKQYGIVSRLKNNMAYLGHSETIWHTWDFAQLSAKWRKNYLRLDTCMCNLWLCWHWLLPRLPGPRPHPKCVYVSIIRLCGCVRKCVCIYVCMYVYVYLCMCVCMCVCKYVCMYVRVYVCMCEVCMCACVYVCMYAYFHACLCICWYDCRIACQLPHSNCVCLDWVFICI